MLIFLAQEFGPDLSCVIIGAIVFLSIGVVLLMAAFQAGYAKGRDSVLDEDRRGFPVLPPEKKKK